MQLTVERPAEGRGEGQGDLNARAFACTLKCIAGGREGNKRLRRERESEIDDLYRREVMDSGSRLRRA